MNDKDLYLIAKKALLNAYAPFSNYKVGAALLTKDGQVFTGANVENSSYGASICAERTAIVKAVSEGKRDFDKIAVCIEKGEAVPCGICRQFIYEFGKDIKVITGKDENNLKIKTAEELLPEGFKL